MPALIMFTSGTTGFPKGVIISQANLLHSCTAISKYLDYHRYRSAAVVLPLHYSYALLSQVCCQLFVGGCVRLFANFRNPIKFSRVVNAEELATFCGVPFHLSRPGTGTSSHPTLHANRAGTVFGWGGDGPQQVS